MALTMGQTTGQQLVVEAKYRADMVNSTFVTDAEWATYVNKSYRELFDLLISKYGNDWFVPTSPATPAGSSITCDGTNDHYALPTDFYHLLGADLILSGSGATAVRVTLKPFAFAERNKYSYANVSSWFGRTNIRYRLKGQWIWFKPLPAANQKVELWYLPRVDTLTCDGTLSTDTVDGVMGWEEYIIIDAAIKAKQKEESDVSVLFSQKAAIVERIEAAAENRDAGSPAVVADVSGGPYGSNFGGDGEGGW